VLNSAYFRSLVSKPQVWYFLFGSIALAISIQNILLGVKTTNGVSSTHYNNYEIFSYAFEHLVSGRNLYQSYPLEHYDLFKYSPAFALTFGFFHVLPDWLGLSLWNILNAFILIRGIQLLKGITLEQKGFALLILLVEMMTNIHNSQSNGLMAGLIIMAIACLQRDKIMLATFLISITVFIKLFGIVAFGLFLFFPGKLRMIKWTSVWFIAFSLIPLLVVSPSQLLEQYSSWKLILSSDHSTSYGFSFIGWLHYWFSMNPNKTLVLGFGVIVFLLSLLRIDLYKENSYRLIQLSHVLIWVILFNHMSESPTLIIAMSGVAIWYVHSERSQINNVLLILAILLTSFSTTDLFPFYIRKNYIYPYVVKVFPLILIWFKLLYDLIPQKGSLLNSKIK
jgi:hypothetical protein